MSKPESIKTFENLSDNVIEFETKQEFMRYYDQNKDMIDRMHTRGINSKFKIKGFKIGRKNKELILFPMKEEFKDDQKDFPDLDLKLDAIIDRQKRFEHLIKELIKFIQPSEKNPNNQLQSSYTLGVADIVGRTVQTPYR